MLRSHYTTDFSLTKGLSAPLNIKLYEWDAPGPIWVKGKRQSSTLPACFTDSHYTTDFGLNERGNVSSFKRNQNEWGKGATSFQQKPREEIRSCLSYPLSWMILSHVLPGQGGYNLISCALASGGFGFWEILDTHDLTRGTINTPLRSPLPIKSAVRIPYNHSSGAVWESRWPYWAVRPNEPSGFRGRKDLLNRASALVTACP